MPATFAITTATTIVQLDDNRRGEAIFTVTNTTGRQLPALVRIVALDATPPDWLMLVGPPLRTFSPNGTHQYTVEIGVPGGSPKGRYTFRLDVAGEENPDEDYAQGPIVAFEVEPSKPDDVIVQPKSKGYVESLLGAVGGGLAGGLLAAAIGVLLALLTGDSDLGRALGLILLPLLAFPIGYWVGSSIGCWLALRLRRLSSPVKTAVVQAVVFPLWGVPVFLALSGLGDIIGAFVLIPIALVAAIPPPLAARAAIIRLATGAF